MWRRILNIVLMVLAWGAILAYILYTLSLTKSYRENVCVERVEIDILDSTATKHLVNRSMVERELKNSRKLPIGKKMYEVNCLEIKRFIEENKFIENANVYPSLTGVLHIDIEQRNPIMRLRVDGYDSYVTTEGYIFRAPKASAYHLPVVTGSFRPLMPTNFEGSFKEFDNEKTRASKRMTRSYEDFNNLIAFVKLISEDEFWSAEIVQFVAGTTSTGALSLQLIPRSGGHIIEFGELTEIEAKMARLEHFYEEGFTSLGWDRFKTIDIRYDKQVICRE